MEFPSADTQLLLREAGATIAGGHFVFPSWRHGDTFVDVDRLVVRPRSVYRVTDLLASPVRAVGKVDVVVGSGANGAILAHALGLALTDRGYGQVQTVSADVSDTTTSLRPLFKEVCTRQRVLVVEDILTTGTSCGRLVQTVASAGGTVIGVATLVNRGKVTAQVLGVPWLHALVNWDLVSWAERECPLCRDNVPVNREFGRGQGYHPPVRPR